MEPIPEVSVVELEFDNDRSEAEPYIDDGLDDGMEDEPLIRG